ncbi:AAA family ATPase [Mitsuaria sp. WAJ17]|uniref:AAA family ATPase n=1 Tax=Mitsuaria sp. WAJ17 TaxID=2761452 RepID=UPI00160294D8|nr:AAA family ATPase [Mitsuaria sp. WAJ17]MBB2487430.1 AAA family ATPase [Mitsuaria sp. WAJ17]
MTAPSSMLTFNAGSLLVLSGLPGAGKTRLRQAAQGLPEGAWVSMDELRRQVLGTLNVLNGGRPQTQVRQEANDVVYHMAQAIVAERMRHGLSTVVDATNLTDADRQAWIEHAQAHGAEAVVLIVDTPLDECLRRMSGRTDWVPQSRILEMLEAGASAQGKGDGFERRSVHPYRLLTGGETLCFRPRPVATEQLDVVSDVHGLLDDLLVLLAEAGWQVRDGVLRHADAQRRLLFLGDLVDRGPDSLPLLELVQRSCEAGTAQCLQGNHEAKLLKFVDQAQREGIERWGSWANAETGMNLLKLPEERRQRLLAFMRGLPPYLVHEPAKVAFVHGDVHRFDPFLSLREDLVHGQSGFRQGVDSDALYAAGHRAGLNAYLVIRGHVPPTSEQDCIVSIEAQGYQKGELRLLRFDEFLAARAAGVGVQAAVRQALRVRACSHDQQAHAERQFGLAKALEALTSRKLVRRSLDPSKLLRSYKYAKEVFWLGAWDESPYLIKARGIVLDAAGTVVSNPFDKVFNYGEREVGRDLPDTLPVVEALKLNGFLGIISPHPLKRGELLVHTQGSLDPENAYVRHITELLQPRQRGLLARFFSQRPMTLMLEVLHPQDPHIVEYGPDEHGLYLIGARTLGFEDPELPEDALDPIAEQLALRRPWWRRTTLGEVKRRVRECRDEGSMVRADTATQTSLLKMKSPFYLTTKFLARLSSKNARHLFGNPQDFKKHQDEELYPIVDAVAARFDLDGFLALSESERVRAVRDIIDSQQ